VYGRLPHETRGYVPAFIAATYIMNYYCEHGIVPRETTLPLESDTVVVQREVTYAQIASLCNVTVDELRSINPQYRRDIVPVGYVLRLPASAIEDFVLKEDSIYASSAAGGSLAAGVRRVVVDDVEGVQAERQTAPRAATRNSRRTSTTRSQASKDVSVKRGETLSSIAKRNGTTVDKLKKMNNLKNDMIREGQKLRVK
ncbi:MAG: LysM peptidoglycan-binding domain-containing protein, partial [Bacteroidaceae bacterium]|nr:LysM peptidoglycan-binding domain-containing protein [Bacteroidaceae bacterium]